MATRVVCVKMDREDLEHLDGFARRYAKGNRSKVIKDAVSLYIYRNTREDYST